MKEITTVGLDLAKSVFQVHAVDAEGAVVRGRQVKRARLVLFFSRLRPCLVGIEARHRLRHRFEQPLATPGRISGHGR